MSASIAQIVAAVGIKPYFQDENSLIYCADCRTILPKIPAGVIDLCLTDPPYGVEYAEWDAAIPSMEWLEWSRANVRLTVFTPGNRNQYSYPKPAWTLCWARPGSTQRADGGGSAIGNRFWCMA